MAAAKKSAAKKKATKKKAAKKPAAKKKAAPAKKEAAKKKAAKKNSPPPAKKNSPAPAKKNATRIASSSKTPAPRPRRSPTPTAPLDPATERLVELLRAGALLAHDPATLSRLPADPVSARAYTHPALGARVVVRLTSDPVAAGEEHGREDGADVAEMAGDENSQADPPLWRVRRGCAALPCQPLTGCAPVPRPL